MLLNSMKIKYEEIFGNLERENTGLKIDKENFNIEYNNNLRRYLIYYGNKRMKFML